MRSSRCALALDRASRRSSSGSETRVHCRELVMAISALAKPPQDKRFDLSHEMRSFIGRHTDKSFDWDAFPGSRGFPELERAQMRYIGAGGSPKADDPSTLKPGRFTLSLVHQPVGKYAACHSHEVVEHFLVLEGVLTVGWAWGEEGIEAGLGPASRGLDGSVHFNTASDDRSPTHNRPPRRDRFGRVGCHPWGASRRCAPWAS